MATREQGTARGRSGWWFAAVTAPSFSGDLPCVHQHWRKGMFYDDPFAGDGQPEWRDFVAAIERDRKVILTTDQVTLKSGGLAPGFKRQDYIAVFEVADISCEDGHLRFRFTNRLIDLD